MPTPLFRPAARLLLTGVGAAALTLTLTGPAQAAGPAVTCGVHLTVNAKLTKNLTCAGTGVTLASGVKLDLGGHRLTGNGTGTAVGATDSTGNTIVNGTIVDWARSVDFVGATVTPDSPLEIRKVTMARAPIFTEAAIATLDRSVVKSSLITVHATKLSVVRSTLNKSSTTGELNTTLIDRSTVLGGGIALEENNSVRVVDSTLDGSGYDGLPLGCDGTVSIVASTVRDYQQPFYSGNCSTSIDRSTFLDNPNGAINANGTLAVTNSTFRRNGPAIVANYADLTIANSGFSRNATAVDLVQQTDARIVSSAFRRNTGTGIRGSAADVTVALANNTAVDNGGYGINVVQALDLGGNRASGNALGQCVGVVCTA